MSFQLQSNYKPRGDQEQAIAKLLKSVESGNRHQTLLGVTGSGKTFTIANVIQQLDRPTLVISHNKTLSSISSVISIITSLKLISPAPTPTLRRIPLLTKRSSGCGLPRPARCFRG